jgi:hypothetical protein
VLHGSLLNGSDFGGFANGSTNYRSVISNDGKWPSFQTAATNIFVGDNNGVSDVFVTPAPWKTPRGLSKIEQAE